MRLISNLCFLSELHKIEEKKWNGKNSRRRIFQSRKTRRYLQDPFSLSWW